MERWYNDVHVTCTVAERESATRVLSIRYVTKGLECVLLRSDTTLKYRGIYINKIDDRPLTIESESL